MGSPDSPSFDPNIKASEILQPTETRESIQNETRAKLAELRKEVEASLPQTQPGGGVVDGPMGVAGNMIGESGSMVVPVISNIQPNVQVTGTAPNPFNI